MNAETRERMLGIAAEAYYGTTTTPVSEQGLASANHAVYVEALRDLIKWMGPETEINTKDIRNFAEYECGITLEDQS